MLEALGSGIAAGFGIAVPVGAIAVLVVGTALQDGFAAGVAAGAGAATADLGYALVAVFAGSAVSGALEGWERVLDAASAAVLAALAVHGLWSLRGRPTPAAGPAPAPRAALGATYARFVALTVVNPLTVVYFSSLVIGLRADWSVAAGAVFAAGAFAASCSWQTLLAGIGAFGGRRLGTRFRVTAVVAGNLVVLGFAVAIAAGSR